MTEVARISVEIDVPPSVNNLYFSTAYQDKRTGKWRCRRVLNSEGRAYKEQVGLEIKNAANWVGWEYDGQRLSVTLDITFRDNRRRDITNCIKIVEDAASEALGFDDTVVDSFTVVRSGVNRDSPRANLIIAEIL